MPRFFENKIVKLYDTVTDVAEKTFDIAGAAGVGGAFWAGLMMLERLDFLSPPSMDDNPYLCAAEVVGCLAVGALFGGLKVHNRLKDLIKGCSTGGEPKDIQDDDYGKSPSHYQDGSDLDYQNMI